MPVLANADSPGMDVCVPQIISQLYYGRVILEKLPPATLSSLNRVNHSQEKRSRGTIKLENSCCRTCDEISRIWRAHKENYSYQHRVKREFDPDGLKQEADLYLSDSILPDYSTGGSGDETDDFDSDYGLFPIEGFDSISGLAVLTKKYCPTCDDIIDWYISSSDEICPMCDSTIRLQCAECGQCFSNDSNTKSHSESWSVSGKGAKKSKKCHRISREPPLNERIHNRHSHQINSTECPKCNKILKNLSSLRKHSRICKELFGCDLCSFKTSHEPSLKRHISTKHSKDRQNYAIDDDVSEILRDKEEKANRKLEIQQFCLICQRPCKISAKKHRKCERCGNRSLIVQCMKCQFMSDRYSIMYYHISRQCQIAYRSKSVQKSKALKRSSGIGRKSKAVSKKHTSLDAKMNADGSYIRVFCSQCNEIRTTNDHMTCQECSSSLVLRCTRCKTKYTPVSEGCGHAVSFLRSMKS